MPNASSRFVGTAIALVLGFVSLAILTQVEQDSMLANASALTKTVIGFVGPVFSLGILWVTWKDIVSG